MSELSKEYDAWINDHRDLWVLRAAEATRELSVSARSEQETAATFYELYARLTEIATCAIFGLRAEGTAMLWAGVNTTISRVPRRADVFQQTRTDSWRTVYPLGSRVALGINENYTGPHACAAPSHREYGLFRHAPLTPWMRLFYGVALDGYVLEGFTKWFEQTAGNVSSDRRLGDAVDLRTLTAIEISTEASGSTYLDGLYTIGLQQTERLPHCILHTIKSTLRSTDWHRSEPLPLGGDVDSILLDAARFPVLSAAGVDVPPGVAEVLDGVFGCLLFAIFCGGDPIYRHTVAKEIDRLERLALAGGLRDIPQRLHYVRKNLDERRADICEASFRYYYVLPMFGGIEPGVEGVSGTAKSSPLRHLGTMNLYCTRPLSRGVLTRARIFLEDLYGLLRDLEFAEQARVGERDNLLGAWAHDARYFVQVERAALHVAQDLATRFGDPDTQALVEAGVASVDSMEFATSALSGIVRSDADRQPAPLDAVLSKVRRQFIDWAGGSTAVRAYAILSREDVRRGGSGIVTPSTLRAVAETCIRVEFPSTTEGMPLADEFGDTCTVVNLASHQSKFPAVIHLVVTELLRNAWKYADPRTNPEITVKAVGLVRPGIGRMLCIEVANPVPTGSGTPRSGSGLGLGLASLILRQQASASEVLSSEIDGRHYAWFTIDDALASAEGVIA